MNSGFYEIILIGIVGIIMIISVIRFIKLFYKNPSRSIQLIRLNKSAGIIFTVLMSANFIFAIGYFFEAIHVIKRFDLIAILIYAIIAAFFFLALSQILSKKSSIK